MSAPSRFRRLGPATILAIIAGFFAVVVPAAQGAPSGDDTPVLLTPKGEIADEVSEREEQGSFDKLRDAYYWSRLLSGDQQLSIDQAAALRTSAVKKARATATTAPAGATRGGAWASQGPAPIVQNGRTTNKFQAVAGRVGALVIRNNGTIILGAAQGGVWTYDAASGTWTSRTVDSDTQAVGALALAPSDDRIVYMGSGEGALSGDSYYGDGFYRSTDGGATWQHVSTLFTGQAVTDIAVDPTNPQHVYASTVRGRGGNHRTTKPPAQPYYGVWESQDAGVTWTLRKGTTNELHGATDLVMDPQSPQTLFASFWGDGIYKSTNGGATWALAMNGLPDGNWAEGGTRMSLGISHPAGDANATLYTGFDWWDQSDVYHTARVFKSTDGGASWAQTANGTGTSTVANYCGTQCSYDNETKPDPTNPNVVYVVGSYGYNNSPQSGGIYRSTDGGLTWKNLGLDLHPDFHAVAFQPTDTSHIAIGNDGGVWESHTGGGRNNPGDPLSAADWQDLNGTINPSTGALIHSTGLAITQFSSIATVPLVPGQYWGGTQDNGTLRKSLSNSRWFDQASGDGGQVIVDQTTPNTVNPNVPSYVFGTYTNLAIYRYDPSETNTFFGNEPIDGGLEKDRAEFYIPWIQNRNNVNQMFLGSYRVYRTDNAEAASAGDVTWKPISGDLTSGCTGAAPNGARGCFVSALGMADGGDGLYAGTDEGWIQVSPNATTSDSPTWTRVGAGTLPNRPVNAIAVDKSNWRTAYAAYGGFAPATPGNSGHLFATTNGGKTWTNITNNLPDAPVNSVVVDPADAQTLYVGTDVGPFISTNGGQKWFSLGTGLPRVAVWQLDYDASHGVLAAGTHGRGAYTLTNATQRSALVVSKADSGKPVGPNSTIDYTITVKNIGNAAATGVSVTDPVPTYTSFVSAGNGGYLGGSTVHWDNVTVPAGGSVQLTYRAHIAANLPASVTAIVNDGILVKTAVGTVAKGSPHTTPIAPPHGLSLSPSAATEGGKDGSTATFVEHLTNTGYADDTYSVSTSGGSWTSTVYDASCATPITTTTTVSAGDTVDVCVKVDVPAGAAEAATDDTTFTAASTAVPTVTGTATLTAMAAQFDVLLVANDTDDPGTSGQYYDAALEADNVAYGTWDLKENPTLPASYLAAHKDVVWFTGNAYPAPITPYESQLKALLDAGGRLFMSGQDILDQAAGRTAFVHDYLHIAWDGSEVQNDRATTGVHSVAGNPVTDGIGTVPLDHSVLGANFEDEITPVGPAESAFTDDASAPDALTVADGSYKVVFLGFPFEAYGTAAQKAELMNRALTWFAAP